MTFYAKMPEDKNYEDGTPKSVTVDFPKITPAAPALAYKADHTNQADAKVTITPVSGAEYSFDGGKTWTDSNEQGGFTTSQTVALAIRLKETATHNQSPAQAVTVNLAKKDREAPPAFTLSMEANRETDYTVTIPATEGCEYSFDGEHWSDVNVKTGINVGETVTGYKRYKETDDYNASSAVDFSVKTVPVNIVNNVTGESYSIQISLAHEGEFGFTAVLSIGLGKENAGYTASLYYYNESTGELAFICADNKKTFLKDGSYH